MNSVTNDQSRLRYLPIAWFSMIMGLSGLTLAWMKAESFFGLPTTISSTMLALTTALFALLTVLYLVKIWRYPLEVTTEVTHPVKLAFVPTFSISLLLLSIAYLHLAPETSWWLWLIGASLHLIITLYVLSSWVHHNKYEIAHLNPAWFIPVVGNILVPIAGIHHAPADVSWFFFSIGLFFWPVLTAILFYRLIFHTSLAERFMPTLFIFIAPPAVGFISWFNLVGQVDSLGLILYSIGLFFTLLVLSQAPIFAKLKFFLSWWAYSFPIAAITIATLIMAQTQGGAFYSWLGIGLLGFLTMVVLLLSIRTLIAVLRKQVCIDGH